MRSHGAWRLIRLVILYVLLLTLAAIFFVWQRGAGLRRDTTAVSSAVSETGKAAYGILALNSDKSIYRQGDKAYLQFAALHADGHTRCDAALLVTVTPPSGRRLDLSTEDGAIKRSGTCLGDNVTEAPDYFAMYHVVEIGTHELTLEDLDTGRVMHDRFESRAAVPFEIERIGNTRIYPPAEYTMAFRIKANEAYVGTVMETVPSAFKISSISDGGDVTAQEDGSKTIAWDVDWKRGETYRLSYAYDAEDISPRLLRLGPLAVGAFSESRTWLVASDAVKVSNGTGGGTWASGATWVGGVAPVPGDDVVIVSGDTVTLGAAASITNVTINAGGTLAGGTFLLTVSGNYANSGTHGGTGGMTMTGVGAVLSGSGTYGNTGTLTLNTGNKSIASSSSLSVAGTIAIVGAITVTNDGAVATTAAGGITGTVAGSTWVNAANSTLNFGGNTTSLLATGTLTATAVPNTVNYTRNGAQTCKLTSYHNLEFSVGGTKTCALVGGTHAVQNLTLSGAAAWTMTTAVTVSNSLLVSGGTLTTGSATSTVSGPTTISGGTLSLASNTGQKIFVGAVTVSGGTLSGASTQIVFRGGLNQSSGTVAITGTATFNTNSQALGGTLSITTLTVASGITLTNGGVLTTPGTLTVTGSFVNNSTVNALSTLTGAGTWTQGVNSFLSAQGSTTNANAVTTFNATASGNTVNYDRPAATGTQTCKLTSYHNLGFGGNGATSNAKTCALVAGTHTVQNLTVTGTATWTMTTAVTIASSLTVSGGTVTTGAAAFTVSGPTTISGGTVNLTNNTGAKTFVGAVTVSGGTLSGASTQIVFRGGLSRSSGTVAITGTATFNTDSQALGGTLSITTLTVASGITLTNGGSLTVTGVLTATGSFANNGTVSMTNTGAAQLAGAGTFTNSAASALFYTGSTITVGTFSAAATSNTVTYNSTTTAQTVRGGTYGNLTVDKSGQIATLGGATALNGNLVIAAGTLDVGSGTNYALGIKGGWSKAGTFTPRLGIVTFNGSGTQTILGSNVWYGLAITASLARSVVFESGTTQTVPSGGSLTLSGTTGQRLTLGPSSAPAVWRINIAAGASQSITDVSVSYADASPGAQANATASSNVDGGNNLNWAFYGSTPAGSSTAVLRSAGFANTYDQYTRYAALCFNVASCTLVQTITADSALGLSQLQVLIDKVGSPSGAIHFDLCEIGGNGDGCGTILRSWSIGAGAIVPNAWKSLSITPSLPVTDGHTYLLRISKDGEYDYDNHYRIGINYKRYGQTGDAKGLYYWYRSKAYGANRRINTLFLGS